MALDGIPRRSVESDPVAELMGIIRELKDRVAGLERAATLRNASISGGDGLRVLDNSGNTRVSINTTDGAVVAYDGSGNAVARFGPLTNSHPGSYGVEVLYNGSWVQVGAGNVDWGNVSNKPATFPPSGHTHSGGDITSNVAGANYANSAGSANSAALADGSQYAFNNTVGGTTFYAVWVGNDGGYHLGRNTSSIRYKQNVREHRPDPAAVLNLIPVIYDRKAKTVTAEDGTVSEIAGATDEFGLIAEQVAEHVPELVTWFDGEIDGVRYDLLAVALLNVVREQDKRIRALEADNEVKHSFTPPAPDPKSSSVEPGDAPAEPPAPMPYTIDPLTP